MFFITHINSPHIRSCIYWRLLHCGIDYLSAQLTVFHPLPKKHHQPIHNIVRELWNLSKAHISITVIKINVPPASVCQKTQMLMHKCVLTPLGRHLCFQLNIIMHQNMYIPMRNTAGKKLSFIAMLRLLKNREFLELLPYTACIVSGSLLFTGDYESCYSPGNYLFINGTTKSL